MPACSKLGSGSNHAWSFTGNKLLPTMYTHFTYNRQLWLVCCCNCIKLDAVVCETQLFRSLVGCIATCAVAAMSGKLHTLGGQRATRGLLAVRGIAGSASMTGLYQAILMLPLADAVCEPTLVINWHQHAHALSGSTPRSHRVHFELPCLV